MKKHAVIGLVSGLAGGILAHWTVVSSVHAQNPTPTPKEIRAQSFTLVDSADRPAGTFTVESGLGGAPPGTARIVLRDARGRVIWTAGGSGILPLTER